MAYKGSDPTSTYFIRTVTDLDNLASGGVITISSSTQLIFENISAITTSNRFNITAGTLALDSNGGPKSITYTGGSTFFTISGSGALDQNEVNINGATTGTLFSSTSTSQIEIDNSNFTAWSSLGSVYGAQILSFRNVQFIIYTTGMSVNVSVLVVNTAGGVLLSAPSTALFMLNSYANTPIIQFDNGGTNGYPADAIYVSPEIPDTAKITLQKLSTSGNAFDTTGSSGSFTAVADAAITATTITSVADNSGVARFNFSGGPPTVYVNQEITITGFVTNTTYNTTGIVTATDGTSYFEMRVAYTTLAYTGTEASVGSFTSDSITVTSATHGLSNGQALTLDCDQNTDYDGGATIYNSQTNTFQVNMAYTATQTGTWDTSGLDQTDPRVLLTQTPDLAVSRYIFGAYVNNNTTDCGTITNNVFKDCVFGTAGSALTQEGNTQRWKLIDDVKGIFEYTGNEPFDGTLVYDFTAYSAGGNQLFRFKWLKDSGSGFVDLNDPAQSLVDIGADASSVTKTQHISMEKGWQLKPQVTRNAGTSTVVLNYATINAQE